MRFLLSVIGIAFAAEDPGDGPGVGTMWGIIHSVLPFSDPNQDATAAVETFAQKVVDFVFPLVVGAAICVIIYAGFKMVTSGEEGFDEAKSMMTYALVGLVLSILTKAIFEFVGGFLLPTLFG